MTDAEQKSYENESQLHTKKNNLIILIMEANEKVQEDLSDPKVSLHNGSLWRKCQLSINILL